MTRALSHALEERAASAAQIRTLRWVSRSASRPRVTATRRAGSRSRCSAAPRRPASTSLAVQACRSPQNGNRHSERTALRSGKRVAVRGRCAWRRRCGR
eukprot:806203-Pleurochrysis_carterae.AAC.1